MKTDKPKAPDDLVCGDASPLSSIGATRRADQSADTSAHSKEEPRQGRGDPRAVGRHRVSRRTGPRYGVYCEPRGRRLPCRRSEPPGSPGPGRRGDVPGERGGAGPAWRRWMLGGDTGTSAPGRIPRRPLLCGTCGQPPSRPHRSKSRLTRRNTPCYPRPGRKGRHRGNARPEGLAGSFPTGPVESNFLWSIGRLSATSRGEPSG